MELLHELRRALHELVGSHFRSSIVPVQEEYTQFIDLCVFVYLVGYCRYSLWLLPWNFWVRALESGASCFRPPPRRLIKPNTYIRNPSNPWHHGSERAYDFLTKTIF